MSSKYTHAIETKNLTRRFEQITAVNNLSIQVPRESVYGFLGPNGAGKTTTIRILLGLIRLDSGQVRLFGTPSDVRQVSLLRRAGSLIESPSLYMHLTGRENLEVTRRLLAAPRTAIDRVLTVVRLERDAGRLVRSYSHGMKQRLGLALAMLNEPELLILDEPTNGLDPAGIHEMRDLLRRLPKEHGMTIFLSSHLLSEVEQIATHIGIVNGGRLLFQGTLDELQARQHEYLTVEADCAEDALTVLSGAGWRAERSEGAHLLVFTSNPADAGKINRVLVMAGIDVSRIGFERMTLENIFLNLTGSIQGAEGRNS